MEDDNATLGQAVERVNGLVAFYAGEKNRLEDNVTKLLLPAGLSFLAVMSTNIIDAKLVAFAWFLIGFFLAYALTMYADLFAAERAFVRAHDLQGRFYAFPDRALDPVKAVVSGETLKAWRQVEDGVGRRRYVLPTGKPLIALIGGGAALLIHALPGLMGRG